MQLVGLTQKKRTMKERKKFFMDCHLAGRKYYDADEVWNELKVGTVLKLEWESDNRYDPNAVAVLYEKKGEKEPYFLGYIPRGNNQIIANMLEMGWEDIFECRISKLNPEVHSEGQVHLTIRIKRNSKKR